MKTKKQNKHLNLKTLTMFGGVFALAFILFSCKGADNNNNNQWGFQNCANCGGLVNGQSFFNSQSTDMNGMLTVNLNFIGSMGYQNGYNPYPQQQPYGGYNPYQQQQPYGGYNPYQQQQPQYGGYYNQQGYNTGYNTGYYGGYNPIVTYQGPVAATGQLQINQGISTWGCMIPPGSYTLNTIQAGQWSSAMVSGLVLQASNGGYNLMISIPQAQVSAKAPTGQTWNEVAPQGRLFGNFVIQSVNGMNCQFSTLIQ